MYAYMQVHKRAVSRLEERVFNQLMVNVMFFFLKVQKLLETLLCNPVMLAIINFLKTSEKAGK